MKKIYYVKYFEEPINFEDRYSNTLGYFFNTKEEALAFIRTQGKFKSMEAANGGRLQLINDDTYSFTFNIPIDPELDLYDYVECTYRVYSLEEYKKEEK
jgi:hypothetical protein